MSNASPASADPLIGAVLDGRYRVDAPIGSGGMCVVYRGFDQRLERPVAVKIADTRFLGDPSITERFDFEARVIARLSDPALIAVYDQGSVGGRPYLVLEHVAGGTARALLAERGAMPPYAAAAVLEPVLRALGAAHRLGLVHGDVKPENILISTTGEVKIADFGNVTTTNPATGTGWTQYPGREQDFAYGGRLTSARDFGTVGYLAPEQVETTPWAHASPAIDVYAAGVTLYELLTGELPFSGADPAELAEARLRQDVPPPSRAVDGVPLQFDHLVLRATERDLRARYPDAGSMAHDLEKARTELGLPTYLVPAPTASSGQPQPAAPWASAAPAATPQHPTVDLTTVMAKPEPGPYQPAVTNPPPPAGLAGGAPGVPPAKPISWRKAGVWLVVMLILGVLAAIVGWDAAAILEHWLQ